MTAVRAGVHQDPDAGYLKRQSKNHFRNTLQIKSNMVKGSRNDEDLNYLQRNIAQSVKLNLENKARLCATGLTDAADRQGIIRNIATTHKSGCSVKNKCFKGQRGQSQEYSTVDVIAPTQTISRQSFHSREIIKTYRRKSS